MSRWLTHVPGPLSSGTDDFEFTTPHLSLSYGPRHMRGHLRVHGDSVSLRLHVAPFQPQPTAVGRLALPVTGVADVTVVVTGEAGAAVEPNDATSGASALQSDSASSMPGGGETNPGAGAGAGAGVGAGAGSGPAGSHNKRLGSGTGASGSVGAAASDSHGGDEKKGDSGTGGGADECKVQVAAAGDTGGPTEHVCLLPWGGESGASTARVQVRGGATVEAQLVTSPAGGSVANFGRPVATTRERRMSRHASAASAGATGRQLPTSDLQPGDMVIELRVAGVVAGSLVEWSVALPS